MTSEDTKARPGDAILLVEDNPDDVFALKRAIKKAGVGNPLHVASDGKEAIDYLTEAASDASGEKSPMPFLVLLDLKLPYRDGFQILEWIRNQPRLGQMVVVMLTGSDELRDHQRAYELGARSYIVKPASVDDIRQLLDSLRSFWMKAGSGPVVPDPGGRSSPGSPASPSSGR